MQLETPCMKLCFGDKARSVLRSVCTAVLTRPLDWWRNSPCNRRLCLAQARTLNQRFCGSLSPQHPHNTETNLFHIHAASPGWSVIISGIIRGAECLKPASTSITASRSIIYVQEAAFTLEKANLTRLLVDKRLSQCGGVVSDPAGGQWRHILG